MTTHAASRSRRATGDGFFAAGDSQRRRRRRRRRRNDDEIDFNAHEETAGVTTTKPLQCRSPRVGICRWLLPASANSFKVTAPGSGIGGGGGWRKRGRRAKTRRRAFWAGGQGQRRARRIGRPAAAEVGGNLELDRGWISMTPPIAVRTSAAMSWETLVCPGRPGLRRWCGRRDDDRSARGPRRARDLRRGAPRRARARCGSVRGRARAGRLGGDSGGAGRRGRHGARQPHRPHPRPRCPALPSS